MRNATVCSILLFAILFLGIGNAIGQFQWTKDNRSPVLTGVSGTWYKHVFSPSVLYNEDSARYEMWFAATGNFSTGPAQYGRAVSKNGVDWSVQTTPVMSPSPGTWDAGNLDVMTVIRENKQYKMWYTAYISSSGPLYIGYATSPDGTIWTKYAGNPVLGPGTGEWENTGPYGCSVMPVSGGYKMWYSALGTSGGGIGYATSVDGAIWVRDTVHNPVLGVGLDGAWDSGLVELPVVVRIDSSYYMWYTGQQSGTTGFETMAFGVAVSRNGVTGWTKHQGNPVLSPTPGAWDETLTGTTAVLQRGDTIHMWHDGYRLPIETYQFRIGHATAPVNGIRRLVPQNYATIQTAIDSARNDDTVLVSDGTYYENIRFRGKKIVVASTFLTTGDTSHISKTIIDGSYATNPNGGSVVSFVGNEDTTSILCGFTITGGTGTSYLDPNGTMWREGGGVFCDSSGAKLVRNNIVRNRVVSGAAGGGGVGTVSFGATPLWIILEENRITDNYVLGTSGNTWGTGGGVDINGMSFRIVGNVIERDTAIGVSIAIGGGLNLYGLSTSAPFPEGIVQGNIFRNNIANGIPSGGDGAATGAGVFCYSTGPVVLTENTFEGNTANAVSNGWAIGGGICIDDREAVGAGRKWVTHNQFRRNQVKGQAEQNWGGAIDLFHAVATVSGNLVSANSALGGTDARGGGIQAVSSSFRIENNIVTKNRSSSSGGGLQIQNSPQVGTEQVIVNNTVVENDATTGGGISTYSAPSSLVLFNNILWADTASTGSEVSVSGTAPPVLYCDIAGGYVGTGNISVNPRFVDSTYRLSDSSFCIGMGADSVFVGGALHKVPSTCYFGSARPTPAGSKPDMGACENHLPNPQSGVADRRWEVPTVFALEQNYPNPFNPQTVVSCQLPVASHVRIVVYDLLGRQVAVLLDEQKAPGKYQVEFDGAKLSSGVYIYRLTAGNYVESKRMILLR